MGGGGGAGGWVGRVRWGKQVGQSVEPRSGAEEGVRVSEWG